MDKQFTSAMKGKELLKPNPAAFSHAGTYHGVSLWVNAPHVCLFGWHLGASGHRVGWSLTACKYM
jgi:hypothetical protein